MKKLLFISFAAALSAVLAASAAASTLIGSQVTATVDYPTFGNVASVPITQTVTSAVEFPSGSLQLSSSFGGSYIIGVNMDVSASSIDLTYTQGASSLSAPFNGYVFDFDGSSPVITGVTLDPASSFTPAEIGLSFGPHEIAINVEGLGIATSSQVLVDASFGPASTAAPEPASLALLALGLVGIVAATRLRRNRESV